MQNNLLDAADRATLSAIGSRTITVRADSAEWGVFLVAGAATVTRNGLWAGTVTWETCPSGRVVLRGWTRSFAALDALESAIASRLTDLAADASATVSRAMLEGAA